MNQIPVTSGNLPGQNDVSLSDTDPLITNLNMTADKKEEEDDTVSKTKNDINDDDGGDDDKSSVSSVNNSIMCRICHCEETSEVYLISPCYCTGTLRYVHQSCLQQWLKSNGTKSCELCKFDFIMQTKIRPFKNWEKLDMNNIERRKILCSVTFHVIAISCVIWSLYVLIERTAEEIKNSNFDWAFWIKLIVVAIGFTGGCVFMYIQCKMYFQLCLRWRQYNRVIIIQPISDEALKNSRKKLFQSNSNSSSKNNLNKNKKTPDEQSEQNISTVINLNE